MLGVLRLDLRCEQVGFRFQGSSNLNNLKRTPGCFSARRECTSEKSGSFAAIAYVDFYFDVWGLTCDPKPYKMLRYEPFFIE